MKFLLMFFFCFLSFFINHIYADNEQIYIMNYSSQPVLFACNSNSPTVNINPSMTYSCPHQEYNLRIKNTGDKSISLVCKVGLWYKSENLSPEETSNCFNSNVSSVFIEDLQTNVVALSDKFDLSVQCNNQSPFISIKDKGVSITCNSKSEDVTLKNDSSYPLYVACLFPKGFSNVIGTILSNSSAKCPENTIYEVVSSSFFDINKTSILLKQYFNF